MEVYPEIELESDEILINLTIKKDYSIIENLDLRKKAFFNDLKDVIKEFEQSKESLELIEYYDGIV